MITELGFEDPGGDGLERFHPVAIWSETGSLLVVATIPAGTAAPLKHGWRYIPVNPTLLKAGATYVIAAQTTGGIDLFSDSEGPGGNLVPDCQTIPGLSLDDKSLVFSYDTFRFPELDGDMKMRWAPANAIGYVVTDK